MNITWEIEDGYVGKSRPQHTKVPDDEIRECERVSEATNLIYSYIDDDFYNNINWCLSYEIEDEVRELLKEGGK